MPLVVTVVGAGIGGLTAAIALARSGCSVTVIERRTDFGETGAGLQLSPNATRILIGLGLGPSLAQVATEPDGIAIRDLRSGRMLGCVALGRTAADRYGAPYWFMARADLHAVLLGAARSLPAITLRLGASVRSLTQDRDGVRCLIREAAGTIEEGTADVLVGADGIGSSVRAALGDGREPVASGFVAYRATAPADPRRLGDGSLWLGSGRHVVAYPVAGGGLNLVAVVRRPDTSDGWSAPVEVGRVRRALHDVAPDLAAILEGAETWSAWTLRDLPVRSLGHGRVALLGDAGHPALPFAAQGAGMAIEDSATLAACLANGVSAREAVGRYASTRRRRVTAVQRLARLNARLYHAGPVVATIRNIGMSRLGPQRMLGRYDWLYGWRTDPGGVAAP